MSKEGIIQENSIMHKVAEAILTHPQKEFTGPEIWEILHNDYPEITPGSVSNCLAKNNSPLKAICNKTPYKKGMATIYERISVAAMPPIQKLKKKHKTIKKVEPIPDTVTDYQIGQSMILYIDRLRTKIKDMATSISDMQAKHKSETRLHTMTLQQKNNTIEKLQEELKVVRTVKKSTSRTFNLKELSNL